MLGYLQEQRALVLLDEVERERSELERLRDSLPAGTFVCASQARRLWGEGESVALAGLGPEAGVALIERELGRSLAPGERATAEDLVARLHGHPLAILQAAGEFAGPPTSAAGFGQRLSPCIRGANDDSKARRNPRRREAHHAQPKAHR